MATRQFEYWRPGEEERRLRLFISHRYDKDEELYSRVIDALNSQGFAVQDISLSKDQAMAGPRGGELPKLTVQAEIAARIYTSDILIAPSRVGITSADWLTWEIQLAAVGYGLPVLFVNAPEQVNKARIVSEIEALGVPFRVCDPETTKIVGNVIDLVKGRPTWSMRQEETDSTLRFRGPPVTARATVLNKFPFESRLPNIG